MEAIYIPSYLHKEGGGSKSKYNYVRIPSHLFVMTTIINNNDIIINIITYNNNCSICVQRWSRRLKK